MTTGKTIALTRQTFVGKVMSLLLNMLSRLVIGEGSGDPLQCSCLENPTDRGAWWAAVHGVAQSRTGLKRLSSSSRLVIAFLPSSKGLLISWVQSPSAVILIIQKEIEVRVVESTMCPYQSGFFILCCGTRNPEIVVTLQQLSLLSFSCSMHRSNEAVLTSSFQDSCWWTSCHLDHADHWSRRTETPKISLTGK